MTRTWTDRDGTTWEVNDGYRIGTLYPEWGAAEDLTDEELQELLDEAREE